MNCSPSSRIVAVGSWPPKSSTSWPTVDVDADAAGHRAGQLDQDAGTVGRLGAACPPRSPWWPRSRRGPVAPRVPSSSSSEDGRDNASRMSCSCIQQSNTRTRMNRAVAVRARRRRRRPRSTPPRTWPVKAARRSCGDRAEPLEHAGARFPAEMAHPALVHHSDVVAHMVERGDVDIGVAGARCPAGIDSVPMMCDDHGLDVPPGQRRRCLPAGLGQPVEQRVDVVPHGEEAGQHLGLVELVSDGCHGRRRRPTSMSRRSG